MATRRTPAKKTAAKKATARKPGTVTEETVAKGKARTVGVATDDGGRPLVDDGGRPLLKAAE